MQRASILWFPRLDALCGHEAVDNDKVVVGQALANLLERVVEEPPPLCLVEEGVLGAEEGEGRVGGLVDCDRWGNGERSSSAGSGSRRDAGAQRARGKH